MAFWQSYAWEGRAKKIYLKDGGRRLRCAVGVWMVRKGNMICGGLCWDRRMLRERAN